MAPPVGVMRRWPRVGERVLLVGKNPLAGQEAVVLRMEVPWGIRRLFGAFPRVRTDDGREDYIIGKHEWLMILTGPERERRREIDRRSAARRRAARKAVR